MNTPNLHIVEQRRLKRWPLIFYLRVFDPSRGALLGHVVDISENGMLLISDQPIPLYRNFRLWLDVPRDIGPRQRIALEARSLWSKPDVNPDFHDTGFEIVNQTPYVLRRLRFLIEEFKSEFSFDH